MKVSTIYQFVLILFMAILLIGIFAPMSNISLAQTATDTSVTNSTRSNYLTYEDTAREFIMQYPSDWNKTDYPPTTGFISPAQNATDKFFESIIVTSYSLPIQNVTLDQLSHSLIEELGLKFHEFDVLSPPKETMLGGVPAYNLTYTFTPSEDLDPPMVAKSVVTQIWTVKDDKVYSISYARAEGQINYNIDNAAKRMIDSFELLPSRQINTSEGPQTVPDKPPVPPSVNDREYLTYENSTLGIKMQYPSGSEILRKTVLDDEDVPYDVGFRLLDEKHPESSYDVLFVEVIPLQYAYNVSESVFIDEYVPVWVSGAKESLTDFNLTKSRATTLDDSPAQVLEHTHFSPELEGEIKGLNVFAVKDNILYRIGYESTDPLAYYDHIPIIQKMIESFEILDTKGMPQEIF